MNSSPLLDALQAHQRGDLPAAEAGYRSVLSGNPEQPDALHYLGVIAYQRRDHEEALSLIQRARRAKPDDAAVAANLGLVLQAVGRLGEAAQALETSLALRPDQPEALHNLGLTRARQLRYQEAEAMFRKALELAPHHTQARRQLGLVLLAMKQGREAAKVLGQCLADQPEDSGLALELARARELSGDLEGAAAEYGAVARRDPRRRAGALCRLSTVLRRLGRQNTALVAARAALFHDDQSHDAVRAVGQCLKELGRLEEAARLFGQAHEMLRAPSSSAGVGRVTFSRTSKAKLRHDIEQFRYLMECGIGHDRFPAIIRDYEELMRTMPPSVSDGQVIQLPARVQERMRAFYNRCHHLADAPAIPGGALNPGIDPAAVSGDYRDRPPGITWIDGFLKPEALEELRKFCLESTIWYDFEHTNGYLGAYLQDGFSCPLLVQIANELPAQFPQIFHGHRLMQLWAYKYDSSLAGIDMHADFAAVNVNFWITPTEATLDEESGGMVIWDKEAPPEWSVDEYNTYDPVKQESIRRYLEENGARELRIPHRQNRCVIFNSDLFHKTDDIRFREGYENRRINVTMLYGRREHD
jgi:tetratricopeptide (TPR) repeat protein